MHPHSLAEKNSAGPTRMAHQSTPFLFLSFGPYCICNDDDEYNNFDGAMTQHMPFQGRLNKNPVAYQSHDCSVYPWAHIPLKSNVPNILTRLVSRLLGLALVSWATDRVGVHHLIPSALHFSVFFHSLFFICH